MIVERPTAVNIQELFDKFPWIVQASFVVVAMDPPVWQLNCVPDGNMSAWEIDQYKSGLIAWVDGQVPAYTKIIVEVKCVGT